MVLNAFKDCGKPRSVLEAGCATAPNLVRLKREWPDIEVGGFDVNEDAIKQAVTYIPDGKFYNHGIDEIYFSTNSTTATLSDACLIYVERSKIKGVLKEFSRISTEYIVLCEFHSTSWIERMALKLTSGYNAYDYKKLLSSLGYHDIQLKKIPAEIWPGMPWERYGYIITAKCPTLI
uniref:Putative methyltransferase n=1 Tax=viral metagenome TaxID=1070528 RepID=A0A6H1ZCH0_9ZZZZ